jgi:rare lipoprotein A
MKKNFFGLILLFTSVIIPYYVQAQGADIFRQEGIASWYGKEFEGRPTASGEIFDSSQLTAAHPSLPFGTMLVVTNQHNDKKVTVRVNDRGPFVSARIIDVSRAAAEQLDMIVTGTAPVVVESIDRIVISPPVIQQSPVLAPAVEVQPAASPINTQTVNNTVVNTAPVNTGPASVVQPVIPVQVPNQIRLIPQINIVPDKNYRLQVGSYRIARNAVDTFDRLKNSGLSPAYERFTDSNNGEFFRVVLAGIRGIDVQLTAEKLRVAGFKEVLIREEN